MHQRKPRQRRTRARPVHSPCCSSETSRRRPAADRRCSESPRRWRKELVNPPRQANRNLRAEARRTRQPAEASEPESARRGAKNSSTRRGKRTGICAPGREELGEQPTQARPNLRAEARSTRPAADASAIESPRRGAENSSSSERKRDRRRPGFSIRNDGNRSQQNRSGHPKSGSRMRKPSRWIHGRMLHNGAERDRPESRRNTARTPTTGNPPPTETAAMRRSTTEIHLTAPPRALQT